MEIVYRHQTKNLGKEYSIERLEHLTVYLENSGYKVIVGENTIAVDDSDGKLVLEIGFDDQGNVIK